MPLKITEASLRRMEMTGYHVYLRQTPAYILAARCSGTPLPGMDLTIDAELLRIITDHDAVLLGAANPINILSEAINITPGANQNPSFEQQCRPGTEWAS